MIFFESALDNVPFVDIYYIRNEKIVNVELYLNNVKKSNHKINCPIAVGKHGVAALTGNMQLLLSKSQEVELPEEFRAVLAALLESRERRKDFL